jgi:HAD superfamily hydrolase (TIGR01456 family)
MPFTLIKCTTYASCWHRLQMYYISTWSPDERLFNAQAALRGVTPPPSERDHKNSVTIMSKPTPDFGVVFDIDGVLVRYVSSLYLTISSRSHHSTGSSCHSGGHALAGAAQILRSLREHNVPHIYLTNNGGVLEEVKAAQIGALLELAIDPAHMVLSHTPMRDLVAHYGDKRVLLMGSSDVHNVARHYGFQKLVTVNDLVHHHPGQFAFGSYEQRTAPFDGEPIEAIISMHDPIDWGVEIQVAVDVLIGGDPPGSGRADGSQTPLFVSNDDFLFSSAYPHPRFAQGAFTMCLQTLYKARTGKDLELTRYGKPQTVAYTYVCGHSDECNGIVNPLFALLVGTPRSCSTKSPVATRP